MIAAPVGPVTESSYEVHNFVQQSWRGTCCLLHFTSRFTQMWCKHLTASSTGYRSRTHTHTPSTRAPPASSSPTPSPLASPDRLIHHIDQRRPSHLITRVCHTARCRPPHNTDGARASRTQWHASLSAATKPAISAAPPPGTPHTHHKTLNSSRATLSPIPQPQIRAP